MLVSTQLWAHQWVNRLSDKQCIAKLHVAMGRPAQAAVQCSVVKVHFNKLSMLCLLLQCFPHKSLADIHCIVNESISQTGTQVHL